jgi:Serine dehydrogenase proteinase
MPQPAPVTPQTIIAQLAIPNATTLISAIEQKRGTRVICLVYNESGPFASALAVPVISALEEVLSGIGKIPKLDLLLRTTGGMTEVPWRIVSLLREFTDELGVIVSRIALSAGCHIAMGADDLVMGPFSVLGSVDPTRQHQLLPMDPKTKEPIPTSVQDLKHCIQFVREQLGDSYPQQNLALIISELFKYINPLALGALEQSYNLSRLITQKVLKTHKTALPEEQIKKIVDILSGLYFSHAFLISRAEVETDLGLKVTRPDTALSKAVSDYENHYLPEFRKLVPAAPSSVDKAHIGGFLETTGGGWGILQLIQHDKATQSDKVTSDPWIKFR